MILQCTIVFTSFIINIFDSTFATDIKNQLTYNFTLPPVLYFRFKEFSYQHNPNHTVISWCRHPNSPGWKRTDHFTTTWRSGAQASLTRQRHQRQDKNQQTQNLLSLSPSITRLLRLTKLLEFPKNGDVSLYGGNSWSTWEWLTTTYNIINSTFWGITGSSSKHHHLTFRGVQKSECWTI